MLKSGTGLRAGLSTLSASLGFFRTPQFTAPSLQCRVRLLLCKPKELHSIFRIPLVKLSIHTTYIYCALSFNTIYIGIMPF